MDFVVKYYVNIIYVIIQSIYENISLFFRGFFFFFLSFIVSEINFIFCSETRILKEYVVQKPDCFRLIVSKQHLIEAAVRRCSSKQVVLKISQYSQENTSVGVSFS